MSLALKYKMKKRMAKGGVPRQESDAGISEQGHYIRESKFKPKWEAFEDTEKASGEAEGRLEEERKRPKNFPKHFAKGGEARHKQDEGMSKQGRYVRQANLAKDLDYNEDSEGYPYMERAKDEAHKRAGKEMFRQKKFPSHFAEGGMAEGEEMASCPNCGHSAMHGAKESGYVDHMGDDVKHNSGAMHEDGMGFNMHGDSDEGAGGGDPMSPVVKKIMMARKPGFSKGGRVANEDMPMADFEDNSFDDLANRDDLEFHDTGENSGDELGNAEEDHDRKDVVSKIMASRKKKDRNPRPA